MFSNVVFSWQDIGCVVVFAGSRRRWWAIKCLQHRTWVLGCGGSWQGELRQIGKAMRTERWMATMASADTAASCGFIEGGYVLREKALGVTGLVSEVSTFPMIPSLQFALGNHVSEQKRHGFDITST